MRLHTAGIAASTLALTAAVMFGLASSPAMAAPAEAAPAVTGNVGIELPNGRGYMTYIDDGDVFTVCDTRADGHGVTGYVRGLVDGDIVIDRIIDDGGDAGCDSASVNIIGRAPHDMFLCWNGGGDCVVSPVITES